ncbi:MAG: HAD hydrolase-like protein [Rhodothermia bacterium]|nr:HAD hydrolase-like protein [Rhodothermia bacterium]
MAINSAPRPIRCLLFDMDGVLVDVSRSYRRAILDTASEFLGKPVEPIAVQEYKNRGGYNDDWELTYALIKDRGGNATLNDVVDAFQRRYVGTDFAGYIRDEPPLIDRATLRAMGSLATLGIVTGRPRAEAAWTMEYRSWSDCFDVLVAREDQGDQPKPHPYPLIRAFEMLSEQGLIHSAADSAYVGDTVDDMRAAVAAGILPIGFVPPYLHATKHGEVLKAAGASQVLTDLSDLTLLLKDD